LRRESFEEIGCAIENIRELCIVEEFRGKFSLHQLSYCFLADLAGEKGTAHLEPSEIADGFQTVWMDIKEATATIASETSVEDYEGKFIQKRDLAILKLAVQR
jgi:ADP-ribose pyrophosphatase YjhB (NUDIX family)